MLSNAFSKLKPSPKSREKVLRNQEGEVSDMTPNMAITPSRSTADLLASGTSPEFLLEAATTRLDKINTKIDETEAQRKDAINVHAAKEGPLSPAVGRPPSFSRPKLADRCKPLAKEFNAVDQTGEKLAKLKPQAKALTSEIEYLRRHISLQSPAGRNRASSVISVSETEGEYVEVENQEAEMGEEEEVPVEMTRGCILKW